MRWVWYYGIVVFCKDVKGYGEFFVGGYVSSVVNGEGEW